MIAAHNLKELEACHIGPGKSVQIEDSSVDLSFGGVAPFSIEAHFFIEPCSEPILPPGHQQGPAQWHGHQVLVSKFNGCVSGEYRLGLDSQRRVIFQREIEPWIVTTPDPIPTHEWHSVVATYDGVTMRIYVDSRMCAQVVCGAQKADTTTPVLLGADLCGYASAHHFEGYLSEVSIWARCLDVEDIRLLAQHGPTGHSALLSELVCYWCLYQRTETAPAAAAGRGGGAIVYNNAQPHMAPQAAGGLSGGLARFRGRMVAEGDWAIGRYRGWLYSGCASDHLDSDDGGVEPPLAVRPPALPGAADGADGSRATGVLFSAAAQSHLRICGSASALSFGETQPYTLAVQFYPRPTRNDGGAAGRGGGGEQVLLSKFNAGLRGEYRLGLDAHGRPFVGREAEPWALLAPEPVSPNCWHSAVGVYDGETLRLFVDHVLVAQAPSAAQFCDQVSPVLIGCDLERDAYGHFFDGFIAEVCIWKRALGADEVAQLATAAPRLGTPLHRGLLGCWRLLESKELRLHAAGRVVVPNGAFDPWRAARADGGGTRPLPAADANGGHVGAAARDDAAGADADADARVRSAGTSVIPAEQAMHAVLRTASHTHSLALTMRAGVQALVLELGAVGHELSPHWVAAVGKLGTQSYQLRSRYLAPRGATPAAAAHAAARRGGARGAPGRGGPAVPATAALVPPVCANGFPVAAADVERRYCYMGMSVALQKNLTQALDLQANELLVHRLSRIAPSADDLSLARLHAEYRQKLVDVRGRAWALFREWFFDNPVNALRECDGDRCEFWRFKFPQRRVRACQVLVEQALHYFPPKAHCPLIVASFGSGLLFQDFCTTQMLIDAGFRHIRLALVDSAYRPWKLKYLQRDSSCRVYVVPSAALDDELLRPDVVPPGPTETDEASTNAAIAACNSAISFVLTNDALHQFIQWFSCVPDADVQILLYDSVDGYIADCKMAPEEMACQICSAMDYKDNETLLEDAVNHMMVHSLAPNGIGIKLVTKPNEALPGVYVVDQQLREIYSEQLPPC